MNPKFQKQIVIDYHFEEVQKLAFHVFDIDDHSNDVTQADFLGKCEATLGQVILKIRSNICSLLTENLVHCDIKLFSLKIAIRPLEAKIFQVVSAANYKKPLDYNGANYGAISVQAQEQGGMQKCVKMTLKGVKLDKKDFFG